MFSVFSAIVIIACTSTCDKAATVETEDGSTTTAAQDPISRGGYLTTLGGCNDCHSPKIMTLKGPRADTIKVLSGHPAGSILPPIVNKERLGSNGA